MKNIYKFKVMKVIDTRAQGAETAYEGAAIYHGRQDDSWK